MVKNFYKKSNINSCSFSTCDYENNNNNIKIFTTIKNSFPGQYFDNETNLNYNIHRDYNPVWGRYTTSDPLGLAAGINIYGYVGRNSLGLSDKLGLFTRVVITDAYYNWKGLSPGHAAIQINNNVFGFFPYNEEDWFFKNGEIKVYKYEY